MTLTWDHADVQILGDRKNQEDFCRFHVADRALLCVLADGMGGHAAGEVAAQLAVDAFMSVCLEREYGWYEAFVDALKAANDAIRERVCVEPDKAGMGCTLVAAEISEATVRWISVGDSRLLRFSQGALGQLNADHSMAAHLDALARSGEISTEQAQSDPSRHMLLAALTGDDLGRIDYNPRGRSLAAGDLIILASDGLDTLARPVLEERLSQYAHWRAGDIARALVSAVIKAGKPAQDNTTVMVTRAPS